MIKILGTAFLAGLTLSHGPPGESPRWRATLSAQNGSNVSGSGAVEATGMDSTKVSVSIQGGTPNASYAWHLHRGGCGSEGGIMGSASAYPELKTESSGAADAQATLNMSPPAVGDFSIHVHRASSGETGGNDVTVACGELKTEIVPKSP